MRPYLAIVKDSFREAFASRVLWIVLIIITLFLFAVSPLTYRQTLTTGVREDEIAWTDFIDQLRQADEGKARRGVQRIWSLLSTAGQKAVADYQPLPSSPQLKDFAQHAEYTKPIMRDLESILQKDDLYQSTAFSTANLRLEGKELLRRESELTSEERQRLNRLLFESAFGDAIDESKSTSLQLRFGWFDMLPPLPISKPLLVTTVRRLLPFLVDKGLLAIGLLVAIVVTAPAIPHTFETGSLHLLLSKPVSRSLLYVSKFIGSCAFVLLCATYLFIGLYVLLGLRWAVWEPRLLWCIPIYTFVFAVYYSVAALAGLIWRNVIVSILVAILFWALCFTVGFSKVTIEASMNKYRVRKIVPAGQDLLVIDGTNTPLAWNATEKRWNVVFLSKELRDAQPILSVVAALPPIQGPVYDPKEDRLVAVMMSINNGQQTVVTASAKDNFTFRDGPAAPQPTLAFLNEPDGQPLLFTGQGLFRPQGDLSTKKDELTVLGYKIPFTTRGPLRDAGPSPAQSWDEPFSATFGPDGTLYTFSRGKLQSYAKGDSGKYVPKESEKFEKPGQRRGWLAASKNTLLVAFRDGSLQLRDPQTLKLRTTVTPAKDERPRALASSPDGKWLAVVAESRRLFVLEDGKDDFQLARAGGQGDISAVQFAPEGKMFVVDLVDRVTVYETGTWKQTARFAPPLHLQTIFYHYLIHPIYTICPKPGEFYRTITYLLLEKAEDKGTEDGEEPREPQGDAPPRKVENPWQPVYSSLAFMLVMLALGCVYMERQEF
ncbi:ABC-2 family transporter protein [Anatilimnocola aggregata]|uniref:ABC-2 family transporter protein n=1 Tax=Anatilimnocola aggregata TaxID=2528021 RepID=A0A517YN27_9BACT|nr:ABC transporter permease subunit [Anatilimnocola aggregata]QDU31614.1 ABC-2 family transporter protein [Anatilimnocola aggregata]